MSCANRTYSSTIGGSQTLASLAQYSSSVAMPRSCGRKTERAPERNLFLEQITSELTANESKSKKHKVKLGVVRDSTRIDPEHVWGDEGPINE
jgi:hypothetical protein